MTITTKDGTEIDFSVSTSLIDFSVRAVKNAKDDDEDKREDADFDCTYDRLNQKIVKVEPDEEGDVVDWAIVNELEKEIVKMINH